MTPEEARRRLAAKKKDIFSRRVATTTIHEKAEVRFRKLLELSSDGATMEEAMEIVRMSRAGIENMLYRKFGDRTWPIPYPIPLCDKARSLVSFKSRYDCIRFLEVMKELSHDE